jgi:hypothetical protein
MVQFAVATGIVLPTSTEKTAFLGRLSALCLAEKMADVRFVFHKGDEEKEVFFIHFIFN